jgi:hypothetical protein
MRHCGLRFNLDGCCATLKRLDSELDKVKQKKHPIAEHMEEVVLDMRLNMSADNIKTFRSQIYHILELYRCCSAALAYKFMWYDIRYID